MQQPGSSSSVAFVVPSVPSRALARGNGHAHGDQADWKELLDAVTVRLQEIRGEVDGSHREASASLLACAEALDQVHAILLGEAGSQRQLQFELFDLRMGLAKANSALAGMRREARLARHEAEHDALTRLPNRHHFRDRLQKALDPSSGPRGSLAVLYLDLDDFKPVNDLHGHAVGDELLRIVATRLARAVRAEDMVSRLGGDEFACLLADLPDPPGLDSLARKLVDIIAAPVALGGLELRVHPSIGIAVSPQDASSADTLLRCADAAMYRAKRTRTGVARFDPMIDDPNRVSIPSTDA